MSTRVLIVDDEQLVRAGFRMILDSELDIEVIGEAADGLQALELSERERPDVVLMDVRMPHLDGVEATRRLAELDIEPLPRVLIVTTFGEDQNLYGALRAGASGFILKDAPSEELVSAVRVLAIGECHLAPALTRRLIDGLANPPRAVGIPSSLNDLTERELHVFRLIASGLSNSEIADELVVSEATVKSHIGHIFAKLELRDRAQAVVLAYETGLVEPDPVQSS
jgi:DNA-binding NarL/FixJ family response regulator